MSSLSLYLDAGDKRKARAAERIAAAEIELNAANEAEASAQALDVDAHTTYADIAKVRADAKQRRIDARKSWDTAMAALLEAVAS